MKKNNLSKKKSRYFLDNLSKNVICKYQDNCNNKFQK